jgi:hypothetical protein
VCVGESACPCVVVVTISLIVCVLQADTKLREEEKRAVRYLETRRECNSVQAVSRQTVYP